jgi:hypothetical protein
MRAYFFSVLFLTAVLFMPEICNGQMKYEGGDKVVDGNTITYSKLTARRYYFLTDYRIPLEKDYVREITIEAPLPLKLNGEKIYSEDPFKPLVKNSGGYTFVSYILFNLRDELSNLNDGDYHLEINGVIFDKLVKL